MWLMDGARIAFGSAVIANPGGYWSIAAAADFNGDGKADILWRGGGGELAMWLMDGTRIAFGSSAFASPGPGFALAAAADFGGDGKADLLWRGGDGHLIAWQMDGPSAVAGGDIPYPGDYWLLGG